MIPKKWGQVGMILQCISYSIPGLVGEVQPAVPTCMRLAFSPDPVISNSTSRRLVVYLHKSRENLSDV